MKKLMVKFLVACLVISILPISAFAEYTVPDYAVKLNLSADRIYEGETVDISFIINTADFLITDMGIGYDTAYFEYGTDTSGNVEFYSPEIKGRGQENSDGSYELATKFTFTAESVRDTVKVAFDIDKADIVYSYESARDDVDPNVLDREGTSVVIVKRHDVTFENNGTAISAQTIEKGLDDEADTALQVPDASVYYDDYVGTGLEATYYEHVWKYNGTEYTDDEIAEFGKAGSANEITEDTTFVLEVRPQTFNVTVPSDAFDTTATPDEATYGDDYEGKIHQDLYDDKYDYTVIYNIDGIEKEVECSGDEFTIPGEDITGDMTLSYEKTLNVQIEAHAEYLTGYFLITVNGDAQGYTLNNHEMYKSNIHDGLRAWIWKADRPMSEAEAEAEVEDFIYTSTATSVTVEESFDVNNSGDIDINDATLVHGAYKGDFNNIDNWVKECLIADIDASYEVDTDDFDLVVDQYKGRNNQ